jgi:EAL domain-containing protein (putative c-di-GMP-specific phosphodiesterase class I)
MARGLNLDLIAEGVENRTQLRYLRSQGCSEVQGFIFSDPVPADQVKLMLQQNPFRAMVLDEQPEAATAV